MVDGFGLADVYTPITFRAETTGKTAGCLSPRLLLGQGQFHFPEIRRSLLHRSGRDIDPGPQIDLAPFHLIPNLILGKLNDRKGQFLPGGEQLDSPEITIDGESGSTAIGYGFDEGSRPLGGISTSKNTGFRGCQGLGV